MRKVSQNSILIFYILILALGLRLPLLNGSLWLDEAAQALESSRPWSQQLQIAQDFQPPLLHLLLFAPIRVSTAEWWLRAVGALLPGLITIWASYQIGKKLLSHQAGVLSALLLATSSFHIFYSQELRPYSLPAMWASLSWLFLLFTSKKNNRAWWGYTISTILGLYSSYLYPFLWFSQLVWLAWQRRGELRKIVASTILPILSFLPWLPSFFEQLQVGGQVRQQLPGWESVVSITQLKAPLLVLGKFLYGVMNIEVNAFFLTVPVLLVIFSGMILLNNRQRLKLKKHQQIWIFLFCWLVIPALTSWLVSFWVPVVRPKRLLMLMPAFYLFFAWLSQLSLKIIYQQLGLGLFSIIMLVNLISTAQYHLNPNYQRENWRGLYQEISAKYSPSETVALFSFPDAFAPWRWYDTQNYPVVTTGELSINNVEDLSLQIKSVADYRYIIVFDYLKDLTDPEDQLRQELWSLGFHEIDTLNYPQIGFVRIYSRGQPTASR